MLCPFRLWWMITCYINCYQAQENWLKFASQPENNLLLETSAGCSSPAELFAAYTVLLMDFYGVAQSVNAEGYISLELMYYDATRIKCTSFLEKEPSKPICNKPQPWKHTESRACVLPTTAAWTAAFQPQSKPAATTPRSVRQHSQWQSCTTLE